MRYKASDTSDAANKARLNVDEKYFNKCRREMLSVVASGLAKNSLRYITEVAASLRLSVCYLTHSCEVRRYSKNVRKKFEDLTFWQF